VAQTTIERKFTQNQGVGNIGMNLTPSEENTQGNWKIVGRTFFGKIGRSEIDDDFVALDDSAADELVRRGVKLVGLDALSIRKRGIKNRVHETLIDNDIVVLEGVWLKDAAAGEYELICLPLKVDLDGAPVRAVLRKS